MSVVQSSNFQHNQACAIAEGIRQAAIVGASQSVVRTAEIVFYKSIIASCKSKNSNSGLEAAISALLSLQGTAT
jgi:hypothetical protein